MYDFDKINLIHRFLCVVIITQLFSITPCSSKDIDFVDIQHHQLQNKSGSNTMVDYIDDIQGVSVINFTGNYDKNINGVFNSEARQAVLQEFYENNHDDYDFVYIFTDFEYDIGEAAAFAVPLMNDVEGIGRPIYDKSPLFFSENLQSMIDMSHMDSWSFSLANPSYDKLLDAMMHEFMHRWGVSIKYIDDQSQISNLLLGADDVHWSFFLNSNASVMYGSLWQEIQSGLFQTTNRMQGLSLLDLYLAGFIGKESVTDMFVIKNATSGNNTDFPPPIGTEINGESETITIGDIISYEGERIPNHIDSQHSFKVKIILLKHVEDEIKAQSIAHLYVLQNEFQKRFFAETNGLGHMILDANHQDTGGTNPELLTYDPLLNGSFDLQSAIDYLINSSQTEWWSDRNASKVRDTVTVIKAFQLILDDNPSLQSVLSDSILWLNNYQAKNNDEMAWMLSSGVLNNQKKQSLLDEINNNEKDSGGWGFDNKIFASPFGTALTINALNSSLGSELELSLDTIQLITDNINQDYGFPYVAGGNSSLTSSLTLLKSIEKITSNQQQQNDLIAYILSKKLPDNSYGDDTGTAHETALFISVLESIDSSEHQLKIDLAKLSLDKMQSIDGSLQGSVYSTALAIQVFNNNNKPNLFFENVSLSNVNVVAGEQISVNFTIKNSGVEITTNFEVTAYKDTIDANNQVDNIFLDLLTPNETVTSGFSIDTSGFSHNSELILVIDRNNSIVENNENDNSFTAVLVVQPLNSEPELAFNAGLFTINPLTFDRLPFTVNASATVVNLSSENIDNVIVTLSKIETNDEFTLLDSQEFNIAALSNQELDFSAEITQAVIDIPLIITIDPSNSIVERNEDNNTHTFSIRIIQSIDLKITNEDIILPIGPIIGETQNITFSFINTGTVLSSGFDVRVYSEINSDIKLIHQSHINELSGGQQLSRNITWLPIEQGTYNLRFVLDEVNELAEGDETNNEVIIPVQVEVNSLTNLHIAENDITMFPDPGLEGQDLQFPLNVHNNSNLASGSFQVSLSKKNAIGIPNTLLSTQSVANIDSNESLIVNIDLLDTSLQGENDLIFSLDPSNSIEEFSEIDNLVIKRFRVLSKPDALVSAGSFQLTPSVPVVGESLSVEVNISNIGEQSLEQLEASLYYNNSQQSSPVLIETQNVTLLEGGETQTNLFTFTMPNNNQIDTFIIKLDETQMISEGSEANNEASILVGTQDQMLYISQRYFSPNGDGIKDQTLIVFNTEAVGNYSIEIVDDRNKSIKLFNSQLFENTNYGDVIWDGRNNKGILARDGDFRINLLDQNSSILKTRLVTLDTNRSSLFKSIIESNGYNTELSIIESYSNQADAKLSHDGKYLYVTAYEDKQGQTHQGLFVLKADGSTIEPIVPESLFDNASYITFVVLNNGNILMTFEQDGSYKMYMKNMVTGDNDQIHDYPQYIGSAQEIYAYTSEFAIVKGGDGSYLKVYFDVLIPSEEISLYDSKVEHVLKNGLILSQENFEGPGGDGDPGEFGSQYNIFFISFDFTFYPQEIAYNISNDEYIPMVRKGNSSIDGRNFVYRVGESIQVYQTENNNLITTFNKHIGINDNYGFNSHNELYVLNQDDQTVSIYNELGNTVTNTEAPLLLEDFNSYLVDIEEVELSLDNGFNFTANISDMLDSELLQKVISYTDYSDEKELVLLIKSSLIGKFETPACDDNNIPCYDWNPLTEVPVVELSKLIKINYQDLSQVTFQSSDLGLFKPIVFSNIQEGRSRYIKTENNKFIDRENLTIDVTNSEIELSKPVNPVSQRAEILKLASDKNSLLYYSRNNLYANIWLSIQESAIKITATTFDWNFDKYEIYWSLSTNPEVWNFIYTSNQIPDDQSSVFNWIPSQSGQYNIKFIAYDKSGNTSTSIEEITISNVDTSIRNVSVEPKYFSPNGDGNKDFVDIQYDADSAHILINISDEEGNIVRIYEREHQNSNEHELIQWDGKNLAGEVLDDGKYNVSVQGIETEVNLDTTPITPLDIIYKDSPIFGVL